MSRYCYEHDVRRRTDRQTDETTAIGRRPSVCDVGGLFCDNSVTKSGDRHMAGQVYDVLLHAEADMQP